ncbi:aldo/keto reductase [Actinomadura sp. LD22]|uniref:Aldo/keto reductase n=1 Tax=Actinomadura physcomitrii TaxID=2650748 RepID=A0A6I4MX94_9ACTN|nr:aldo/keto reductase [Actinomadura physcomitrii]MWA06996.1 aldo/keto reductase [Actinomadura physcomitrii]
MRYTRLGASGLTISSLVLGTASFGDTVDPEAAMRVVKAALDAGVTTFDTADVYAGTRAEEILGAALPPSRRDQLVLCSKVGLRPGDADAEHAAVAAGHADHAERWSRGIAPTDAGLSRKHVIAAVEDSLSRLRTDYLDLYQVHRFDPAVPLEETLRALDDLVRAGKVRYIGCSAFAAWQLYRALWLSERERLARFDSVQVRYNLVDRGAEAELLPAAAAAGVGVLAFQVFAGGVLTGGSARSSRPAVARRYGTGAVAGRGERLAAVAQGAGVRPAQACMAWALSRPGVTAVIAGASSPEQLADLTATAVADLPAAVLAEIDAIGGEGA